MGSKKIIRLQLLDIYEFRGELAARCILEGFFEMNAQNATRQTIFNRKGSSRSFKIYIFRRGHSVDLVSRKILRLQIYDFYDTAGYRLCGVLRANFSK